MECLCTRVQMESNSDDGTGDSAGGAAEGSGEARKKARFSKGGYFIGKGVWGKASPS